MDDLTMINMLLDRNLYDYQNLSDLFEMIRMYESEDFELAHMVNKKVRSIASRQSSNELLKTEEMIKFNLLYKMSLLFDAINNDIDAYMLYVEFDREPEKKFYAPRRNIIRSKIVVHLQALLDDEIDILTLSLPPGIGKSTVGIFFLTYLMGMYPEVCNLASGHADPLTRGFFEGALSIITDPEYLWSDVFPSVKLVDKNSKFETIDLDTKKRFKTLTCRPIDGTLTGATRCEGILYVDDLVSGIEEAISKYRMDKLWTKYSNDLKSRKKKKCKELHIATRWSVHDPIGKLERLRKNNKRARFISIPALDENGESNFDYEYDVGFDTKYFMDMKGSLDDVSWKALYMNQPIEREGLLFPEDSLRYYNGTLPDIEPDRIYSACDVAWGGGNSLFQPFGYKYGDDVYIDDLIYDQGNKDITRPRVIGKMAYHKPHQTRFEANNGGDEYADKVNDKLREQNIHLNITHEKSPSNQSKVSRIIQWAPDITKFYFIDSKHRNKEYDLAMDELTAFLQNGGSPHDDVPDGLAMLAELINEGSGSYEIDDRPF